MKRLTRVLCAVFCLTSAFAVDIQVDRHRGDDANDGVVAPVKSIARGIELARAGDTIHLAPGTYYETADFSNKHGEPGKPITLNGHGAVLDGSKLVTGKDWRRILPGLYRADNLYEKLPADLLEGWFVVWNGKLNRMDRCPKAVSDEFWQTNGLQPGTWTYSNLYQAFFIQIDRDQSLIDIDLRFPVRAHAVKLSGSGSWITIKNLGGVHVYNDGFSISGDQQHIVFENISAMGCGDDGFSVVGNVDCTVDNLVSVGNGTGIFDGTKGRTRYRGILIKECIAYDLLFLGKEHVVENGLIESEAARAVWAEGNNLEEGEVSRVSLKHLIVQRVEPKPQEIRVGDATSLEAELCHIHGLDVTVMGGGEVNFKQCSIQPGEENPAKPVFQIALGSVWKGERNRYDIGSLKIGSRVLTRERFSEFQEYTGSEIDSTWGATGR